MKILIVSGFLGSGKTTFIKELLRRTGIRPVVMENEYGENNIDALNLQQSQPTDGEMKILEFMEGCVCCTMKDSFVNSVLTVFSGLEPDYLIVEPTGVGKLSSILENLKPVLHDGITMLRPVVVLSPQSYRQNMAEWPELYRDQVINAQIVVFSKSEHLPADILKRFASQIHELNPKAQIVQEHYSTKDDEWWRQLADLPAENHVIIGETGQGRPFSQISLSSAGLSNPAELVQILEDCLRGEFGHIVRAKGIVPVGAENLRFDLADQLYAITGSAEEKCQCVFIGGDLDEEKLCQRMGTTLLTEEYGMPGNYFRAKRLRRERKAGQGKTGKNITFR